MPKKKSATEKPLLFVDTNIFLDFYRARGEAGLRLLNHLQKVSDHIILTDQIHFEFLKNRQAVICEALANLKAPSVQPFVPAYLMESQTGRSIDKNLKEIREGVEKLKRRVSLLLKNPNKYDPVFRAVKSVM